MTTANKKSSILIALIVLGGLIVKFGFVPVVVIGGPLTCWALTTKIIRDFGKRYSHRAAVYNQETDLPFIRWIFNLKDGK